MKQYRKTRNNIFWEGGWVSLMFSVLVGCGQSTPSSPIFFPQMQSTTYMEADITGQLILEENCLRLKHSGGDTSYLLIWPSDFMVREKGDQIQILDETGQIVVTVEDEVIMFGGEVPEEFKGDLEQQMQQEFPAECPGPYWVVAPPE